ncbi:PREDICTED: transcription factor TFIIIB component B'' homolog [Elephantulus edwardii]|uniref:transcription factor TFIIIB component B'' homolog n=1 Tax=Elephantulus edwardii TaxID=28737 RepID=UPI0003F0A5B6|nr:PREDICTED: transcription factor TFIIIB component B'' homolog [Elephantulus edwardii]
MFRRARLSVKPNVRPGLGARGSATSTPQRGKEAPRPPEPPATSAPKPAEPADVPVADFGGAEPQEKSPQSSFNNDEKTDGENNVEESSKSPPTASQRRKRVSSTSCLDKLGVIVPSEPHPLSPIQEVPQPSPVPAKEKQPCSDRYRIYKAQKLREMLREELRKEKKQWKNKYALNESQKPLDRSKMTMRDFIYYLPNSNPMTSSLEQEKKTEKSTPVQTREQENKSTTNAEVNEEAEEEADDGPLLVPRVKVAEDGSIILDEESLTVEVLRTKGPCVVEENDPIFERGSTTTYSSFRKNYYSKPWSNKETDMFFLAISMVGTDFSMIGQLFPHRARIEIKNKFKREEKTNGWRIDKAFQEKRAFDFDFFAHLLQKVLAEEEKRKQKSVKSNNSKEKKPSKPRKNVKAKKVVSEIVNDGPDESVSTKISDTEELEKDIQTTEEQPSLTLSQDSAQITLESNLRQKKSRRRNQDKTEEQEVGNLLEDDCAPSGPKGEKHKSKCESVRPEVNEGECSGEQKLSSVQDPDDIEDLPSSQEIEKKTDHFLPSSNQQDTMSLSTQSAECSTSNLPPSEAGTSRVLSEVNNTESCTEETNVDLNKKSLETNQTENLKPKVRGRLQRPKPNLSRAVGKKPAISQGKTDTENKSSHPETSIEKNPMGKDKINTLDSLGIENSENESTEAGTVSNLSEQICLQEDSQSKTSRPVRLARGRLQRLKPNVGKVAERKEILASQQEFGASEEKTKNEPNVDKAFPEQMEDQSCKVVACGDTASQSEKKDTSFQNVQQDEPMNVSECVSIQESNEANTLKQSRTVRTRFQKLKPNLGRGTRRKQVFSREEEPEKTFASGEMESTLNEIIRLETSLGEKVSMEVNPTKEMEKDSKEPETGDIFLRETIPEITDIAMEMETGSKETEEISPAENILEGIDVLEAEIDLEETKKREIFPLEKALEEVSTINRVEIDLEKTEGEFSPRKKLIPEMTATAEEREADLKETGIREISSWEIIPEETRTAGEVEKDLKTTARETFPGKIIVDFNTAPEEREADVDETEGAISPLEKALEEVKTLDEMETDLKSTERLISPRRKIIEMIVAPEAKEADLEETEKRDIPQGKKVPEDVKTIGEVEKDFKTTEREISLGKSIAEMTANPEEREADLEKTGKREISPCEKIAEDATAVSEVENDLKETERGISLRKKIAKMTAAPQEKEANLEEMEKEISLKESSSETVKTVGEVEKDLEEVRGEISSDENIIKEASATGEREIDLGEMGKENIFLMDLASAKMSIFEEMQADLKDPNGDISLRERESEDISAAEETNLKSAREKNTFQRENEPEKIEISKQTETSLILSSSDNCSLAPSKDIQIISNDIVSAERTPGGEKRNSEAEEEKQLSESKTSLGTSELGKTEDHGMQSPDVPEQILDTTLSSSLPQEQKPFESKTKPFVRSRFKKPKPNLSRATLKREITEAERCVPGKKSETEKSEMETIVIQQKNKQTNDQPQDDMVSLMTPREKSESDHKEEKAVIIPCVQTEENLSHSHSVGPPEQSQTTEAQENDLVASIGACNINSLQEIKQSEVQTTQPVRRRLLRPKPNIRRIEQRQISEKGQGKDITKEEKPVLEKDETKQLPPMPDFQIGTEIDVVSSKVSECSINESQSLVVLGESLHVNKDNASNENPREDHKPYTPSPAPLVRRSFKRARPNLERAHTKRKKPGTEKDVAAQNEAIKPEKNLLQEENSDDQLILKEKTELLTSLEISARKDYVVPKETVLAKKDSHSEECRALGSTEKETIGDNSRSSGVEEQCISKPPSCPKRLKESNYSKIALDQRTAISSASECEVDLGERRIHRKSKPSATKGRGSRRNRGKSSKKEPRSVRSVLVTLRASQQEDEDDIEDFDSDYEEESYHLAPEEVNKAPVFVPLGLRSPEPVPTQIEETMEELEIAVDVPDTPCIAPVEHHLLNTDVIIQEMNQEENLNALSIEVTTSEHTQDETGASDGSTEAAIALLTMGDLVLQSEISTEPPSGEIDVLPLLDAKDHSHVPSSPINVSHSIVHECQELSLPVVSVSPALFEENKTELQEQSARDEIGSMENVKEDTAPARETVSKVTSNLKIRNRFPKPKPNLKRILGTRRPVARQEVPSLTIIEGGKVEIQNETEKSTVQGTELDDNSLGSIITMENKEQSKLTCAYGIEGTSISQEANLTKRNEAQEEGSQEVQKLSVASTVSSETEIHPLGLDRNLGENSVNEPLREHCSGNSVLTIHEPECIPNSIPEVQQESIFSPQDLAVNLFPNIHQDGEDEQTFILTLVEIPTSEVEGFTNNTAELLPNPLLPAPILVKSVNTEEKGDLSMRFPVTSVCPDVAYLSNSGTDDSEKPSATFDLASRKRVLGRLEESDYVPPAKKCSLTSGDDGHKYTSEVFSRELINVFEETGDSYKGRSIFPTSGSTCTTPEPQKGQLESTLQSIGSRSLDSVVVAHNERNAPQLPQDGTLASDRAKTGVASNSEQMGSKTSSSKTPLSRRGRRPLGFLSLICSRSNLESDEPIQTHSKKRLKPYIPVSRRNLKKSNPPSESQKNPQEPLDPLPSSSVVNTPSENIANLAAQVPSDQPLLKEGSKRDQKQASEEESVSISEYFFNDIFIEVDETE